jgi:outer membrane receptor protein involved in Fe transport
MRVRLAEPLAALILLGAAAAPARAQTAAFDIPAGRLSDALIALAEQAGITVAADEPGLTSARVPALRGRMEARSALARLLAGTPYRFVFVGPGAVRILSARPPRQAAPPAARPLPLPPAPVQPEIVVTASKQGIALDRFAGTVQLLDVGGGEIGRFGARGSEAVLGRLPMLAATSLGPGRDKIYIRGVADSSFNGPSQAIVGQYLGDVRLTFNAPDPDLQLYDVGRVELLEGPQGTLYGSGSLGGILRLVPNPPDLNETAGAISGGALTTAHGAPGADGSALFNLPLVPGRLALRAVGYGAVDGGYIDDAGRRRRDVNRVSTSGGRAALLYAPGGGWEIELGGVAQYISGRDGQYAQRGLPPLTRSTSLAQPFDNDYQLGALTLRRRWHGLELVSASEIVRHSLETQFDATGFPGTSGPQRYDESVEISLYANETRLARLSADGAGWVAGLSLLSDASRIRRRLGDPSAPPSIGGVANEEFEAALFGQYSLVLAPGLVAGAGGRFTYAQTSGRTLDTPGEHAEPDRTDTRFSPTAAVAWGPAPRLLLYARVAQGFRAGGLAVSGSGGATRAQRFRSDSLTAWEAGLRFGRADRDPLSFGAAASYAHWTDIQADLIDMRGLPFTANLGSGHIYGFEAELSWRLLPSLSLEGALFLNDSALSDPAPAFAAADERDLPNIAAAGARAALHYRAELPHGRRLGLDAALRYVGRSRLGIGPPADVGQGGYVVGQLGGRLDLGRFALALDLDNVTDSRGNRFAYGNPFALASHQELTPLRPRTLRLGFDTAF